TDGDVRRGLISGLTLESEIKEFIQTNPKYIDKSNYTVKEVIELREKKLRIIPVLDANRRVTNVLNFRVHESYLPVDAVIMAGGKGTRLRPHTLSVPKPLLKVGEKPIIDHNVDQLIKYGIDDFWISIKYLGEQIENHFGDGNSRGVHIDYIRESQPLGTIGAVSLVENFHHDYILVTKSDILTNLNFEDFFVDFLDKDADMSVVTVPYQVDVPYGVLETNQGEVTSLKEKPTYTYFSNGGIYLIKREVLGRIPKNKFYNSTDLMESLIQSKGRVISYPIRQYWLDIGKPEDFIKAQEDVKHINW
ncbi:MAG: nucleotidyltransferase family protein, partial [Marinoscillum sp.]